MICNKPIKITVRKRYSGPCWTTNETITTAKAPVAPETIPGRPPNTEVMKQTRIAAYKPVSGETWAIRANAIASGTIANATVKPLNKLVLISGRLYVKDIEFDGYFLKIFYLKIRRDNLPHQAPI